MDRRPVSRWKTGEWRGPSSSSARGAAAALAALVVLCLFACDRRPRPASVLVVVIDTLRADHLGLYGHGRDTSANIDERAASGVVFERAFSTSSWTLPAMASLLTGRLPGDHGARRLPPAATETAPADGALSRGGKRFSPLAADVPTLATILAGRGFATCALITNPYLAERFGLGRGFERYEYLPRRSTAIVVERAAHWLETGGAGERPFFLLLHLLEPHLPYDPAPPDRGRFSDGSGPTLGYPVDGVHALRRRLDDLGEADRRFIRDAYDEEIASVDRQLATLFDLLDRLDLWRDTLVLLTSDHGEELFEHGGFEHGLQLFNETIRVPLVAWAPGAEPGRRFEPVSLVDLAPTILDALAAADGSTATMSGVSRWPSIAGGAPAAARPILASGTLHAEPSAAALSWPLKAVVGGDRATEDVFNLDLDPGELRPLAEPSTAATRLLTLARRLLEEEGREADPVELDDETRETLRALGYLE